MPAHGPEKMRCLRAPLQMPPWACAAPRQPLRFRKALCQLPDEPHSGLTVDLGNGVGLAHFKKSLASGCACANASNSRSAWRSTRSHGLCGSRRRRAHEEGEEEQSKVHATKVATLPSMLDPPERAALLSVDDADEVHPGLGTAGCNVSRGGSRAGFVDALAVRVIHLHIRAGGDAGDLKGVGAGVGKIRASMKHRSVSKTSALLHPSTHEMPSRFQAGSMVTHMWSRAVTATSTMRGVLL